MQLILAYAATLLVFVALDLTWLGLIAKGFYRGQLGALMLPQPQLFPAVAFYLMFPIGVVLFAALPGSRSGSVQRAALLGAAFGFFAYATYDLTNWATLRDWPVSLTFVDIMWGTCLTAAAAAAGCYALTRF